MTRGHPPTIVALHSCYLWFNDQYSSCTSQRTISVRNELERTTSWRWSNDVSTPSNYSGLAQLPSLIWPSKPTILPLQNITMANGAAFNANRFQKRHLPSRPYPHKTVSTPSHSSHSLRSLFNTLIPTWSTRKNSIQSSKTSLVICIHTRASIASCHPFYRSHISFHPL